MIYQVPLSRLPSRLQHLTDAPAHLYVRARSPDALDELLRRPRVAIVGSRKMTAYGRAVTEKLASQLAAHGVVIISGLALGIDGAAHQAALAAGGSGVAVLPTPVERIYPASHHRLAEQLMRSGGALVSEYPQDAPVYKPNFVARNRLVAALADALVIVEAARGSGSLHTATFAMEQGLDVLAVPGNITSPTSAGTNSLLNTGASPLTDVQDVLHVLGIGQAHNRPAAAVRGANPGEQQLIGLLERGICEGDELLQASGLSLEMFNHHLTMLEITAKIRPLGANQWALR